MANTAMGAYMANAVSLITKYSTDGFDAVYKAEAASSKLDTTPGFFQFTGTKTVKIAKIAFGGLSDYHRNNIGDNRISGTTPWGYQPSNAGLTWEEFTISQDRAAYYPIEEFDNEESGDIVLGNATKEINRTVLVPEVDSFCFSKIASYAGTVVDEALATFTKDGYTGLIALRPLNRAFLALENAEVPAQDQIVFMSPNYNNALREDTTELTRWLTPSDFSKDLSFQVGKYEGREIVLVPPARFRTGYVGNQGGYGWNGTSKAIDFIVMAKNAAVHIVKYNKVKILSGEVALAATGLDGYAIYVRIYHDVFVADNKRIAIYLHTGGLVGQADYAAADSKAVTYALSITTDAGAGAAGTIKSAILTPGDKFVTLVDVPTATAYTVGTIVKSIALVSDGAKTVTITPATGDAITGTVVQVGDTVAASKVYAFWGNTLVAIAAIV